MLSQTFWQEPLKWFEATEGRGFLSCEFDTLQRYPFVVIILDERMEGLRSLNLPRIDQAKPNPKSGTAQLEFNTTGSLLLVRFGQFCVLIYSRITG